MAVPCPTTPLGFWGFLNLTSPASRRGLIEMIFAPFCLAISRAESIRGWLVPGFWPAMTMTFRLGEPALARGFKTGDRVRFAFDQPPAGPTLRRMARAAGQ